MGKRIILLTLTLSMVLVFMMALTGLAAPSITVPDYNDVDTDAETDVDIIDNPEQSNDPQVKAMFEELDNMRDFIANAGNDIIEFFDDSVKEKIGDLLPLGFDLEKLELSEFIAVGSISHDGTGDATATFDFATDFEVGQEMVALVGVVGPDGNMTWLPLKAKVVAGGKVEIEFTEEALKEIGNNPFALGILSEPAE